MAVFMQEQSTGYNSLLYITYKNHAPIDIIYKYYAQYNFITSQQIVLRKDIHQH